MTRPPLHPTDQLAFGARSLLSSSAFHALVLGCLAFTSFSDLPGPVGGEVRARRGRPVHIEFAMVETVPTEAPYSEETREEEPLAFENEDPESVTSEMEGLDVQLPEWEEVEGDEDASAPSSRVAMRPAPFFVEHLRVPKTMVFTTWSEAPAEVQEPELVEAIEPAGEDGEPESTEELAAADLPAADTEAPPEDSAGEADVLPSILIAPAPDYPRRAIRLGQEGAVTCLIQVNAKGQVTEVTVAESSGFKLLDDAAIEAVEKWQFEPGTIAGVPTEREVRHIVRFELTLP